MVGLRRYHAACDHGPSWPQVDEGRRDDNRRSEGRRTNVTKTWFSATWSRIWKALMVLFDEGRSEASLAVLVVTLVLVTRNALSGPRTPRVLQSWWLLAAARLNMLAYPVVQHQIIAIVLQFVLPVLVIWTVHRRPLDDYGFGLGDWRFWLPITALIFLIQIVIVALFLSRDPVYIARYPSLATARSGGALLWIWESSRIVYMLSWEFLFRGYLLFALFRRFGMAACFLQMVPFVLMHMVSGKPTSEVYFTLVSGLLSGLFALEARSIWPIVFLHGLGAVLLDLLIVFR